MRYGRQLSPPVLIGKGERTVKINRIQLNCRQEAAFNVESGDDPLFVFFRTPVICRENGAERTIAQSSAVILSEKSKQTFSPVKDSPLRYDIVSFSTSSSDRQYISNLGIEYNVPVELDDDYIISSTLHSIKSQSMHRGKHFNEFIDLSLRIIFVILSEAKANISLLPEEKIPRYAELKSLRDAMYEEPMNSWSVDEICEDMKISRTYFHRLYMKSFGVSFRQDVIESRLLHAADLLKNTDLSVTAISEICGYDSESYFMRQFKSRKGCTPSEYRRRVTSREKKGKFVDKSD
jgi:AraC-like DNA-binding protein